MQKASARGTAQDSGEATMSQRPQIVPPASREHPRALGYLRHLSDKPHRVSSQSTRVDEKGSPMPSRHALNRRVPGARYDERDARIYPPLLPRPRTPPQEQWGIAGFN